MAARSPVRKWIGVAGATLFATTLVASGTPGAALAAAPGTDHAAVMTVADAYSFAQSSIVQVIGDQSEGSGVRVDQGILTNAHVVDGNTQLDIYTSDNRTAPAHVVKIDEDRDLALLQADVDLKSLDLVDPHQVPIGSDVLALGYPLGLSADGGNAFLSVGHVSGILKDDSRTLVQTDAAINHGESGGALLTLDGRVIGINALGLRGNDAQGVNFAIGSDTVQDFLDQPEPDATQSVTHATFRGDPRAIAVTPNDLGQGWHLADEDTSQLDDGIYTAVYTSTAADGSRQVVGVGVFVAPTSRQAQTSFRQFTAKPSAGARRVSVPDIGDGSYAEASNGQLLVVARAGNVIVMVAQRGANVDLDRAVSTAKKMLSRVA